MQSAHLRTVNNVTRMARVPGVSMVQRSTMESAQVGWIVTNEVVSYESYYT